MEHQNGVLITSIATMVTEKRLKIPFLLKRLRGKSFLGHFSDMRDQLRWHTWRYWFHNISCCPGYKNPNSLKSETCLSAKDEDDPAASVRLPQCVREPDRPQGISRNTLDEEHALITHSVLISIRSGSKLALTALTRASFYMTTRILRLLEANKCELTSCTSDG